MSLNPARCLDVLVVGAGPVGLAAAIALAQHKLRVAIIEQGAGPFDKACGEGIMPAGVEALAALGVDVTHDDGAPFYGIRYIDGALSVRGGFRHGPGWAMRRTALVAALRRRASEMHIPMFDACRACAPIETPEGISMQTSQGSFHANLVVAADGLHSKLRREVGLEGAQAPKAQARFGMRRHYACAPWSRDVEVYWIDGAEAYVTPVGDTSVGVAILCGPKPAPFDVLLPRFVALHQKLAGAKRCSTLRGAGPLAQSVTRRYAGRVVLVGDAAGYLDALTGEGLTLGFLSVLALARVVAEGLALSAYETAYARLSRPYYREAYWLLALAKRPRLRRLAVRLLTWAPWLLQGFVAAHEARRMPRPRDFFTRPDRLGPAGKDRYAHTATRQRKVSS